MENSNTPIFDIDAGVLLAKLHLAAKDQVKTDNGMFIVNTGILNPNDSAKPENIGNVNFDLGNKSGEYQLGIAKLFEYQLQIDLKKQKKLVDLDKELVKAEEKDKKEKEKQKLTDKDVDKKSAALDVQKKIIKAYNDLLKGFKVKEFKVSESDIENNKIEFKAAQKQFFDNVAKENETRKTELETNLTKAKNEGFKSLQTYFKTFSGEQNASKISQNQMRTIYADADGKTKTSNDFQKNIKKYLVDLKPIIANVKKTDEAIQEKEPNKIIQRHIMFLVGYTIEL